MTYKQVVIYGPDAFIFKLILCGKQWVVSNGKKN